MFTGIVTDIGTIRTVTPRGDLRVVIGCNYDTQTIDIGASISCSGVCLTVIDKGSDAGGNWFAVDISGETQSCTAQGQWSEGRRLNLERALKVGDELGGHIVTGHIDGIGEVASVTPDGDSHLVSIRVSHDLAPFIAAKGSITVDGVSLTVNSVTDANDGRAHFTLNIIPHTWDVTTLAELAEGRAVNLEIDVLARYLKRMEEVRAK
ncbi:MAG: riboflavin synthase [Sphingorhabdus sp.]|nr:riboflavin synthase [Sphingorhabdus sp.]